jgi:preprotein translocase subunit SecG
VYPFFLALHVLLCLFLIAVVLLQPGKGGDVGAAFGGGGGSTIFGPRGPTNVLQQATTVVAVLFMVTSITLAIYSNRSMRANANVSDELKRLQQQEQVVPGAGGDPTIVPEVPAPEGGGMVPVTP